MSASKMLSQLRGRSGAQPSNPAPVAPRVERNPVITEETKEFVKKAMGRDTDSEDEAPPQSKAWEMDSDDDSAPDILDPKFDWRRDSRRGRRSRKNYSMFLADRIRENENEMRREREAQDEGRGPDFS
jgi:hypothetical protein